MRIYADKYKHKKNNSGDKLSKIGTTLFTVGGLFILWILWQVRALGVFQNTFVFFYANSILVLMTIVIIFLVGLSLAFSARTDYNHQVIEGLLWAITVLTILVSLVMLCFINPLRQSSLANSVKYNNPIGSDQLIGGMARIKPYEVAETQLNTSFNSTTAQLTNMHIVRNGDRFYWTAIRDPRGFWRSYSKPTEGIIAIDAETSSPAVELHSKNQDAQFRYGPGMKISQGTKWQIRTKHCYTCNLKEQFAVATPDGPKIVIPFTKYTGGLIKYEKFGGVFVLSSNGYIKQYSPLEAAKIPMLANSGRMFPEQLARRYANVYKYKHGIWNKLFVHEDGFEVLDTDSNSQPYLQKFKKLKNPQWVTTMQPRGRNASVGLILFTDAVTGEIRTWKASRDRSYIANSRALDIVRGERLGVNFAGAFRAIEPRQVFPDGRLHYLVSVVPSADDAPATRVTLNAIVDAERQSVVRVFPATANGDADLKAYLSGTNQGAEYQFDGDATPDSADSADLESSQDVVTTDPRSLDSGTVETLQRLLKENKRHQRSLELEQDDLKRLLDRASKKSREQSH